MLSFVIWEVSAVTVSRQSVSPYAGSIGHEKISQKELLMTLRYYDLLSRTQTNSKEAVSSKPLSADQLQALAWQAIVLSREAKHQGIQVSDAEVREEVERLFSIGTGFNEPFYQNWIRTNFRGQPRDFEEVARKQIAVQKIRQKVLEGIPEKDRDARWLQWLGPVLSRAKIHTYSPEKSETND